MLILGILLIIGITQAMTGNYTVELLVTGLQNQNNSGNSSNYTVDTIFPYAPTPANGSNYSATVKVELMGWYIPQNILPPTNWSLLAVFLGMSKDNQVVTSIYSSITTTVLAGFTLQMIVSLILLLLGLALMLRYVLRFWGEHKQK